jgi:hypothetical protein
MTLVGGTYFSTANEPNLDDTSWMHFGRERFKILQRTFTKSVHIGDKVETVQSLLPM